MSLESPISVLFNSEGFELAVTQSQPISQSYQPGYLIAGSGSQGQAVFLNVTDDGILKVTGSFAANVVFPVTQSVEIVSVATGVTSSNLDIGGSVTFLSSANASTTVFEVLAANENRKSGMFFVDGNAGWYLGFGANPTTSLYSVKLTNNSFFQIPDRYTGSISVIANKNGSSTLMITEISV